MKNIEKQKLIGMRGKKQRGYTLLEYCAGAAVMAGIIWAAMTTLGEGMRDYLGDLTTWLNRRSTMVQNGTDVGIETGNPTP